MANKVYQYYTELPSWAKGIVVIGGIAIAYFTTKQFIARIKAQNKKKVDMATVIEQKKEIDNLEKTGLRATFSDSQYKAWADAIQNQFDGCDIDSSDFTIVGAIWKSFKGSNSAKKLISIISKFKNDLDFLKLSEAWKVRSYDQCGWGMGEVTGTLSYAISDELNNSEIKDINSILVKQGINYKF
jgi:hypothetical protein